MNIQTATIPLRDIRQNTGQIEGLPANPRNITEERLAALTRSIQDNPEMLSLRELLVTPHGDGGTDGRGTTYVCLGGNMRLRALSALGAADAPCKIVTGATAAQLRHIALSDNGDTGEWDPDRLAAEWDRTELLEFGLSQETMDAATTLDDADATDTFTLPDGERGDSHTCTFNLSADQRLAVLEAIARQGGTKEQAIMEIIQQWEEQRK